MGFRTWTGRWPTWLAVCWCLLSCGGGGGEPERNFLFLADREVVKPFVWFFADFDHTEAGFDAQLDYGDPFRATTLLMQDWLRERDVATTMRRAEKMIAKWRLDQGGKLDYTFAYGELPAGWWSGMDSWSFPMLLLSLWQDTGRERYKVIADRLIATASAEVTDGGVVWRDAEGCWFSEYAWEGMKVEDEFRVLNGHLYALQAIRMIADMKDDADLRALYECGVKGTKARSSEFHLGSQWVRYMLHPSTINQTHYVIFETMQFDALSRLDPDPYFGEQAVLRRDLLRRYFPVRIVDGAGGNRLWLSALGAPHPYSIDTYPLVLECSDGVTRETHRIEHPTDLHKPVAERVFLDAATALDPSTAVCSVESRYVGLAQRLYEAAVVATPMPSNSPSVIDASLTAILDARLDDPATVSIDPARRVTEPPEPSSYLDTQGRVILTPAQPVTWTDEEFIGLEFGADGPLAIGVTVVSEGREYFRYYPATLAAEKTVVLLSPVGFDGGPQIRNVEQVTMFVYTDRQPSPVIVRRPRLLKFGDQAELYHYFREQAPAFYTE